MAPLAGWYDDPRDRERLRYWDGEAWTDQVTAKDSSGGAPETPLFPGAEQAQQRTWNYGQPAQPPTPAAPPAHPGSPAQQPEYPPYVQPSYPPQQPPSPQQPYPPQQPQHAQQPPPYPPYGYPGWPPQPAHPPGAILTPDGAVVTSWGKRLAARLLDNIFVFIASLPLSGYFFYRAFDAQTKEMDAGTYHPFSLSSEVRNWELTAIAIVLVAQLCYETICLRRWGATAGKRMLSISVRSWSHGGPLAWSTIGRRVVLIYGLLLANLVPVLGAFAVIVLIVDYLWPLWDKHNQALHDKLAGTVVIEGARQGTA